MSWLWGKQDESSMQGKLVEKGGEVTAVNAESPLDDGPHPATPGNDANHADPFLKEVYPKHSEDEASSDESSVEPSSDEDSDDDSIVVNLIEGTITDEDDYESVSDDEVSLEEKTDDDDDEEDEKIPESPKRSFVGEESDGANNKAAEINVEETLASFWEKQSLLVLAAEHDRVDILKTLLKQENEEKDALMNSGIPLLHLAITYGSVNTAQSLLRMGSDPSIRPDIETVLEERRNQPKDSKVEIPNIQRFDGVTAWELAFGNAFFDPSSMSNNAKSWSLFGSSSSSDSQLKNSSSKMSTTRVIKPIDMPPSKREGIRHAFTAEALRSIGGDEEQRLKQLIDSGMPTDIDIGGKDLHGWAVDMDSPKCEAFLRPVEALQCNEENTTNVDESSMASNENLTTEPNNSNVGNTALTAITTEKSSSFVVHRPDDNETISQLRNRLDELDSLANALSTCLDNLAEEVSVCHGLLLMGGGASALASHVRSLRDLKEQKMNEMENAYQDSLDIERELADLAQSTGEIGKQIANASNFKFLDDSSSNLSEKNIDDSNRGDSALQQEIEIEKLNIKSQITASENKIRKLRASITDLSEEFSRDLQEVQNRGLEGGINLVRGLREELRDIEFDLSEIRGRKATCNAKIKMILARVPDKQKHERLPIKSNPPTPKGTPTPPIDVESKEPLISTETSTGPEGTLDKNTPEDAEINEDEISEGVVDPDISEDEISDGVVVVSASEIASLQDNESSTQANSKAMAERTAQVIDHIKSPNTIMEYKMDSAEQKKSSSKIATGDSKAIAVIQPGNRGFFYSRPVGSSDEDNWLRARCKSTKCSKCYESSFDFTIKRDDHLA